MPGFPHFVEEQTDAWEVETRLVRGPVETDWGSCKARPACAPPALGLSPLLGIPLPTRCTHGHTETHTQTHTHSDIHTHIQTHTQTHTHMSILNSKPVGSISEFKGKEMFHLPKTQITSSYLFKEVTAHSRILLLTHSPALL